MDHRVKPGGDEQRVEPGDDDLFVLAMPLRIRALPRQEKPSQKAFPKTPPLKEGRRSADKRGNERESRLRRKKKNSNKGALIKGMTRRLPVQLLGDLSFEEGLEKIMRKYAGVYALYKGEKLYYVGLAKDLYNRLRSHTKNRHRGKWDGFAIFRVRRVRYLKDMETLLLQIAQPPGNLLSGHLHRDADLTRVLREVLRENTLRLKRMRKAFA